MVHRIDVCRAQVSEFMKKRGQYKRHHPSDRLRTFLDVKGTTSLAGNFIFYLVDYFLNDISNNRPIENPARGNDVYMLPVIACVLMAADFEAIRNDLFFKKKKPRKKKGDIGADIASLFSEIPNFPKEQLSNAINEVFVMRDSIIHGHMYEVQATYYRGTKYSPLDTDTRNYRHKRITTDLVEQGDYKFYKYVNLRHKRTKYLKLNVNPLRINYADLFISLMLYDVIDSAYTKKTGDSLYQMPLSVHGMLMGDRPGELPEPVDDIHGSLGQILGHYYRTKVKVVKNRSRVLVARTRDGDLFKKRVDQVMQKLKKDFEAFIPPAPINVDQNWLETVDVCCILNMCPKCKAFGFITPFKRFGECWNCSYEDPREKTTDIPFFAL